MHSRGWCLERCRYQHPQAVWWVFDWCPRWYGISFRSQLVAECFPDVQDDLDDLDVNVLTKRNELPVDEFIEGMTSPSAHSLPLNFLQTLLWNWKMTRINKIRSTFNSCKYHSHDFWLSLTQFHRSWQCAYLVNLCSTLLYPLVLHIYVCFIVYQLRSKLFLVSSTVNLAGFLSLVSQLRRSYIVNWYHHLLLSWTVHSTIWPICIQ